MKDDGASFTPRNLPEFVRDLRGKTPSAYLEMIDRVWAAPHDYLRWPQRPFLFMAGTTRIEFHTYDTGHLEKIKAAGLRPDRRSNGPAVMAFSIAGGERPLRENGRERWAVHHIYDGQFPAPSCSCTRAVESGEYFTQAAGLVAAHPIADALADEFAYFAWLLRAEAFHRFGLDPDGAFDPCGLKKVVQ